MLSTVVKYTVYMVTCEHCQGDHFSNRCPTWPQECTSCWEEHPFGVECYTWKGVVEEEDTSEIDAQIALEEADKALVKQQQVEVSREASKVEYERQKEWRKKNPEAYRTYMRQYMRQRRMK